MLAPAVAPLLAVEGLTKRFPLPGSRSLHAVDDVSFSLAPGESLGVVGESGCGKTTLSRLVARLADPTAGRIAMEGRDLAATPAARFARDPLRRAVGMVFQDPTDSLDPRYTAADAVAEPLRLLLGLRGAMLRERVRDLAALCGLDATLLPRYPHQLSGGQKARVGIARALATEPRLLILDEPTSALDVSVQATVLRLLDDLRARLGLSYLFVSHDLNVVRLLCDRVMVMYLGRVAEIGPAREVLRAPAHPYARALVAAIPTGEPGAPLPPPVPGEPMSPVDPPPTVCRYAPRCGLAAEPCRTGYPPLREVAPGRAAACHFAG